ncbi:DUF2393 family protein [Hydrogenimonas sp.]
MTDLLRHYLAYSFHSLTKYDYMAIGWVLFLALLFLVLALFVKRRGTGYFLLFLGITLLFFGPPAIKVAMDRFIRPAAVTLERTKPLKFSHALLLEGTLANTGKVDYTACDLIVTLYRPGTPLGRWAGYLKPYRVAFERLDAPLMRGEAKPFRILVDDFQNRGDFNVTVIARCYP